MEVLFLISAAMAVVAADIYLRLRLVPNRRDSWIEQLLAPISVSFAPARTAAAARAEVHPEDVASSLLRHFEQSFASRHIVSALGDSPSGMTEQELEQRIAELSLKKGKPSLPRRALRSVVMILMGADFVRLNGRKFEITDAGWALHGLLQSRRGAL